jgi:hypothetical protein
LQSMFSTVSGKRWSTVSSFGIEYASALHRTRAVRDQPIFPVTFLNAYTALGSDSSGFHSRSRGGGLNAADKITGVLKRGS